MADLKVCIDCGLVEGEDKEYPYLPIEECDDCQRYCCERCNNDLGHSGDFCFECYTKWVARWTPGEKKTARKKLRRN